MNSYYSNVLFPFPAKLGPTGGAGAQGIFDMRLAGLGTMSPTIGTRFTPARPPQESGGIYLTHPVGHAHGADCPTCDLQEIPYDPNLPHLVYNG
jgi:hypothetical protein